MNKAVKEEVKRFELFKIYYERQFDSLVTMFGSVMETGQNALKAAFIINRGATIAVPAFLGNLASKNSDDGFSFCISYAITSLYYFAQGVA